MTTDGPEIRLATEEDLPELVSLLAGGALVANKEDPDDLGPYQAALAEILVTPGNHILVAVQAGEVVGACQLLMFRHLQEHGGRCAEIESLHVRADRRGHGVGSALLAHAVARARADGCYRVQLTSDQARPAAHRFYRRHGFVASHQGFKLRLGR